MEIDDKQFLAMIDDQTRQLQNLVIEYNRQANGLTDKDQLFALRIAEYIAIRELVSEFERVLRFLRGEAVEPKAHEARAVLVGLGAVSMP